MPIMTIHDCHYYYDHDPRLGRRGSARPRPSPRHVGVARGPRGRAHAPSASTARPTRDYARLPARQRGPSAQRARLPGPRRLRRHLAQRARQGAARAQGRALYCAQAIRARLRAEAHFLAMKGGVAEAPFLAMKGGVAAKTHHKARAAAPFARGGEMPSAWRAIGRCFEPAVARLFYHLT
jgi:hypothetical protein